MWLVCRNIETRSAGFPSFQMPAASRAEAVLEEERGDALSRLLTFVLSIYPGQAAKALRGIRKGSHIKKIHNIRNKFAYNMIVHTKPRTVVGCRLLLT
jgi:hypothetical protein